MASEQLSQEQTDEIERGFVARFIVQKILHGEASAEVVEFYQSIGPENFGYWLHGFLCAGDHKKTTQSEIFRFINEQIELN